MNTTNLNQNTRRCLVVSRRTEQYKEKFMQMKAEYEKKNPRRNLEITKDYKDSSDYYDPDEKLKISSFKELESIVSTYNGESDVEHWLYKYETIADACCWSDLQKVMYCKRMLRGKAKLFIRLEKCCFSWKELKHCLVKQYSTFDADITSNLQDNLRISDVNNEVHDRPTRTRTSALERFFQKKNNTGNSFILRNSTTVKQLQEDAAYHDSLHMMKDLKLQDGTRRKK